MKTYFQIRYKKDKAFRAKRKAQALEYYYKDLERTRLRNRLRKRKFRLEHPDYYKGAYERYFKAYYHKHKKKILKRRKIAYYAKRLATRGY